MTFVLTLASPRTAPGLDDDTLDAVRGALSSAGFQTDTPRWLDPGIACDVPVDTGDGAAVEAAKRQALGERPVDLCVQPTEGRRKALLIADMDSTMITVECIDELADFLDKKAEVSIITEKAMRGELDFEAALTERVRLLTGLGRDSLEKAYQERVTFTPGGAELVATMRAHGAFTALVSGGFTFFTDRVAEKLGFDWSQANELVFDQNGQSLSGDVKSPILGREAKRQALQSLLKQRDLDAGAALAVGDGANDLAMIETAGLGVAFHAKPRVAEQANARIDHGDLTTLLYFQGFTRDEFA